MWNRNSYKSGSYKSITINTVGKAILLGIGISVAIIGVYYVLFLM